MKKAKKFLIILFLAAVCAVLFLVCTHKSGNPDTDSSIILSDSYSREAYLNIKGWDVSLIKSDTIKIPQDFDGIYSEYAQIQQKQKLPLENYKGKKADRFLYKINNYNGDNVVFAELLIAENRLVAAALIGNSPDSFIKELY